MRAALRRLGAALVCCWGALLWGCGPSAPVAVLNVASPDPIAPKGKVESFVLDAATTQFEADVSAGSAYTLRFSGVSGAIKLDAGLLEASSIEVQVDTTNVTASWQVVADIARDQFLHSGSFPTARFTSSAVRKNPDGTYTLYGALTFHGTTKTLSTPVTMTLERCRVGLAIEFVIDRREFGAVSDGSLDGLVSDSVVVRVKADLKRQDPACAPPAGPPATPAPT